MQFRHTDGSVVTAVQWHRHGDHPRVRVASTSDVPWSTDPGKHGWLDGAGIVLPGDWIVADATGACRVVRERPFRKAYAPVVAERPDPVPVPG